MLVTLARAPYPMSMVILGVGGWVKVERSCSVCGRSQTDREWAPEEAGLPVWAEVLFYPSPFPPELRAIVNHETIGGGKGDEDRNYVMVIYF